MTHHFPCSPSPMQRSMTTRGRLSISSSSSFFFLLCLILFFFSFIFISWRLITSPFLTQNPKPVLRKSPRLLMVFIWVISQLQWEWRAAERKWDFVFRIYGIGAWWFCSLVFTRWVFHFIELVTLLISIRLHWNNKWALLTVMPGTVWALNTWGINNQNRENHVFA